MTRRRFAQRKVRAFTLIAMLVWLVLLSAFAVLASELMVKDEQIFKTAHRNEQAIFITGQTLRRLRADVWDAEGITTDGKDRVALTDSRGRIVTWQSEQTTLTRTALGRHGKPARLVVHIPQPVVFQRTSDGVCIICRGKRTRLVSQLLAAREDQR